MPRGASPDRKGTEGPFPDYDGAGCWLLVARCSLLRRGLANAPAGLRPALPPRRRTVSGSAALQGCSLEQIIKCFTGARRLAARRGGGARLALDSRARREEHAIVALVFRRDARRQLRALRALPARARVERDALNAAVDVDAAARAFRVRRHRYGEQVAAPCAAKHLVRRHQVRRLRARRVLQHTARCPLLRRLRRTRALRRALARVLVAALAILPVVRHESSVRIDQRIECAPSFSFRNCSRYLPQTAGSECVPCPRVCSLVGIRIYRPRFTRGISFSISPSSGGFTTSSAELIASTAAVILSRFGDGS